MKKLAILISVCLMVGLFSTTAFAEGEDAIKESPSGFYYIEQDGDQTRLSAENKDLFINADGLYFKDLNKNGELDVYEDYRQDVKDRVWDLIGQMTMDEKAGTLIFSCLFGSNGTVVSDLGSGAAGYPYLEDPELALYSHNVFETINNNDVNPMAFQIQDMGVTTFIAALTGMPKDQLELFNKVQAIAEEGRLGIPAVFSGDRSYNTWGGMIDMPHYAFGVAHDEDLLYNLVSEYAKESVAIGYHQVFHGYGNEIGSWYGDEVNYIAKMAALETRAYEDNGFNSHSKHFIARGGRQAYIDAKSPADLLDSWLVGWKAVVDAGTQWVMTNLNVARTPDIPSYFDKVTYDILRNDLGYEGIVCMDWIVPISQLMEKTGFTADGIDISTLSAVERYALILNAGVDMLSAHCTVPGRDLEPYYDLFGSTYPALIVQAVEEGLVTEDDFNTHVYRVLKNKFDLGIFEDPYSDWEEAALLIYGDDYTPGEEDIIPMSNEDINTLRRPEITQMEEQLMVESSILLKNDGILPLTADQKINVVSAVGSNNEEKLTAAIGEKATTVDLEEADVCVIETSGFNDAYELMLEDAMDLGIPVVTIFEGSVSGEPNLQTFADSNALLMQTYSNTPDHGSSVGSFYRTATPAITAQMLFGEAEPAGKTLYELAYNSEDQPLSWGELQDDIGVDDFTRLNMAMMAKHNPEIDMPNNLGDVIVTTRFGMNYSDAVDIQLSLLTVPRTVIAEEVEDSSGRKSMQTSVHNAVPKAGEAFTIYFVAENFGEGDGLITAQILDNGSLIAEKLVGVTAGQYRVIPVDIVLESGEHTISVGDLEAVLTVE